MHNAQKTGSGFSYYIQVPFLAGKFNLIADDTYQNNSIQHKKKKKNDGISLLFPKIGRSEQ